MLRVLAPFVGLPQVREVLASGATKASVVVAGDLQVDLMVSTDHPQSVTAAQVIAANAAEVGITVNIRNRQAQVGDALDAGDLAGIVSFNDESSDGQVRITLELGCDTVVHSMPLRRELLAAIEAWGLKDALNLLAVNIQDTTGINCSFKAMKRANISDRTAAGIAAAINANAGGMGGITLTDEQITLIADVLPSAPQPPTPSSSAAPTCPSPPATCSST